MKLLLVLLLCNTSILFAQLSDNLKIGKELLSTEIKYPSSDKVISKIALGSCGYQDLSQPILSVAADWNPDVFLYLGDNIYGDTENMDTLRAKYNRLGSKPEFKKLVKKSSILAVWDDHDYGVNDGGLEYPKKEESKEIFLQFWNEPLKSERRNHLGIYHSYFTGPTGKRIQFIMLDNRTFRTPVVAGIPGKDLNDYIVDTNKNAKMLGDEQWKWLENELLKQADIRIIMSSTQFVSEFNGYELWALKPYEKQRMIDLIKKTKAEGILFVSGDVHFGEVSKQTPSDCYPLYDFTSSGITSTDFTQPNKYRIGKEIHENHFGGIIIDWNQKDPSITFELYNTVKDIVYSHSIKKSELSFPR
jgi:alkaline phosphatase D